jgi:hypothetical protein
MRAVLTEDLFSLRDGLVRLPELRQDRLTRSLSCSGRVVTHTT